jgi:hypothetical protein
MAQLLINTGSDFDTGTGDPIRTAFKTTIANFESWDNNFPLSYLFPYTGSARMNGNLIITGSILYSFDSTSPYSTPSDIDIFTTNMSSNTDITGSDGGITVTAQDAYFNSYILPKFAAFSLPITTDREGHALFSRGNGLDFPIIQFLSSSNFNDNPRSRIRINNLAKYQVGGNTLKTIQVGRALSQEFSVDFPLDYGDGTEDYYTWRISAPSQQYLMDAIYIPAGSSFEANYSRYIAIKQPVNFTKYENIQINGDIFIDNAKITFPQLPDEDPHHLGQIFKTGSENLGLPAGDQIICVSQG